MDAMNPVIQSGSAAMQQVWNNYLDAYNKQTADTMQQYNRDAASWANKHGIFGTQSAYNTQQTGAAKLKAGLDSGATTAMLSTAPAVMKMAGDWEEAQRMRDWQAAETEKQRRANYEYQLQYAQRLRDERTKDYIAGVEAYRKMFPDWNRDATDSTMAQLRAMSARNGVGGGGGGSLSKEYGLGGLQNDPFGTAKQEAANAQFASAWNTWMADNAKGIVSAQPGTPGTATAQNTGSKAFAPYTSNTLDDFYDLADPSGYLLPGLQSPVHTGSVFYDK